MFTGSDRIPYRLILPGIAAFGVACSISGLSLVMLSLLVAPLGRDLGWTPPQIYLALTCATVTTIVAAPLTGRLIDVYKEQKLDHFVYYFDPGVGGWREPRNWQGVL